MEESNAARIYLHDHLLPAEEGIADELARAQRYWLLSVRHVYDL